MDGNYHAEFLLPFTDCSKCELFSIDSTPSTSNKNDAPKVIVISCKHDYVCRNAVKIWKGERK